MQHHSVQMYNYHTWANQQVLAHLRELPEDIFRREIPSVFPSISEVLVHMYVADKMWVEALRKKLPFDDVAKLSEQLKDEMATKNLEEMDAMFGQSSEECRTFFAQHCDLEKTFTLEHPNWEKKQLRIADVVDHLVNHGTYHRGHISAMLRQMGHKGVSTDYVFYLLR